MAPTALIIESDPGLLAEVRRYGQFDVNGCYQCGGCTLTCEVATGSLGFPRKNIRHVQLGLRAPLEGSLEPWICHDCGDCSALCPRQAEPRIAMVTLRRFLHAQYDWTGISARLLRSRAWYTGALVAAALLVIVLGLFYHWRYAGLGWGDVTTPLGLEHAFPIMTYFTWCVVLLPMLLLLSQAGRMWWFALKRAPNPPIPFAAYAAEARTWLWHSVVQPLLLKCRDRSRWPGHWAVAAGVAIMLAVKVFALPWFQTDAIYPLSHPQRWLGYLATALILYGVGDMLVARVRAKKEYARERRLEHFVFPVLLLLTALTGIAAHIFRYAGFELTCHFLYALHVIIAAPMLLVEIPFGHWSHMISRPLALYFHAVRERAERQARVEEVIRHAA